jgi:hypothetical protein
MTEVGWLACKDPKPMLEFLRGKASERKLRLFAVACCRRIEHLITDRRSQSALEFIERLDGEIAAKRRDWEACRRKSVQANKDAYVRMMVDKCRDASLAYANYAAQSADATLATDPVAAANFTITRIGFALSAAIRAQKVERRWQAQLLRDIVGNPFLPVSLPPAWLAPVVDALARAAYEERDLPSGEFDLARLTVLADALEEAGCTEQSILDHLRSPGPHVRGCWAVDLILAKE